MTNTKKPKRFPWLKTLFFIVVVALPVTVVVLIASMTDEHPIVTTSAVMDPKSAHTARALALKVRTLLNSEEEQVELDISEAQLANLATFGARAIPRIKATVDVTPSGINGALSLHIPEIMLGNYINVKGSVLPSTSGLELSNISIGAITVPGNTMLSLAHGIVNRVLDPDTGDTLFNSIQSVAIAGDSLKVVFKPVPDLRHRLSKLGDIRDEMGLFGDPKVIGSYYAMLCKIDDIYPTDTPRSAIEYIAPLFAIAHKHSSDPESAVQSNRSALLALGLFLGSKRFGSIIGDFQAGLDQPCRANAKNVVFAGRHDLVQHFFISSTMQILSNSDVSFAVGEYKELLDTASGGLSVSDIAGNLAGIRFTELVLTPSPGSLEIQKMIAQAQDESFLFPDISGMPPKLPKRKFEEKYGNVEDPRYKAMLADIHRRIDKLALYQ